MVDRKGAFGDSSAVTDAGSVGTTDRVTSVEQTVVRGCTS
jgi:hypothetical protein